MLPTGTESHSAQSPESTSLSSKLKDSLKTKTFIFNLEHFVILRLYKTEYTKRIMEAISHSLPLILKQNKDR